MDDEWEITLDGIDLDDDDGSLEYLSFRTEKDKNEALRVWLAIQFMILNGRLPTPGECHAALDPLHRYIRSGTWLRSADTEPPTPIKASQEKAEKS